MKLKRVYADSVKCVGCEVCEITCSNVNLGVTNPKKSRVRVLGPMGPDGFRVVVCNQCGVCAEKCPEEAISLVNGAYIIDEDLCTQCGVCIDVCPINAIWWAPEIKVPLKCVSCGACVDNCPTGVFKLIAKEIKVKQPYKVEEST